MCPLGTSSLLLLSNFICFSRVSKIETPLCYKIRYKGCGKKLKKYVFEKFNK